MLKHEDNVALTRTDRGTVMGEYVRRFWLPVAASSEVEADGLPVRVRLAGEDLIVFRETSGRVGVMEERCPHRLASLYYGRNEEGGIRCAYHGWKFDVSGACVDMPTEPANSTYKDRLRAVAYEAREAGGLIWAFLGPQDDVAAFPAFEWLPFPEENRYISRWQQDCNFVQAMEGEMDPAHVGFLHRRVDRVDESKFSLNSAYFRNDLAPKIHIDDTPYGYVSASERATPDGTYWRVNQFLLPFYTMITPAPGGALLTRAWVPRDDETCWVFAISGRPDRPVEADELRNWKLGINSHRDVIPGTTTPRANAGNEYLRDVNKQKHETFTGIEGVRNQDAMVVESSGAIVDRTKEHLGSSDQAVIVMRRRLLDEARALANAGTKPTGSVDGSVYDVRATSFVLPEGVPYTEGLARANQP